MQNPNAIIMCIQGKVHVSFKTTPETKDTGEGFGSFCGPSLSSQTGRWTQREVS